jgi:hypothetical protein
MTADLKPRPRECELEALPPGDVLDHEAAYDLFEALRDATANTWHEIAARHLAYHRSRTPSQQDAPGREEIAAVFNGWLERFEHGDPVLYTPAREYASDAVKDCRDLVLALLKPARE